MHQLYFVLVEDESENQTMTPKEAIDEATDILDRNQFVTPEGGFWSGGKCDYFVVGGRWADFFTYSHEWARTADTEIKAMLEANKYNDEVITIKGTMYGNEERRKAQELVGEKAELIWGKHRPKDYPKVRYNRWVDMFHAQNDDSAVRITPELMAWLKEQSEDIQTCEVYDNQSYEETNIKTLLNPDRYTAEYLGKCYLVAIDYHI